MLDDDILELRRKLNESVVNKKNHKKTYKLSLELDKLIAKYYKAKIDEENSKKS